MKKAVLFINSLFHYRFLYKTCQVDISGKVSEGRNGFYQ